MSKSKLEVDKRKNRPTTTHKISITLSKENNERLDESQLKNKSKFINWLLENYYNLNQD